MTSLSIPTPQRRRFSLPLSRTVLSGFLAAIEVAIIAGIGFGWYFLYLAPKPDIDFTRYVVAIIGLTVVIWKLLDYFGYYELDKFLAAKSNWQKVLAAIWLAFVLLTWVTFTLKVSESYSRVWAMSWATCLSVSLPLYRLLASQLLSRYVMELLAENIVIFGAGRTGAVAVDWVSKNKQPWVNIAGVYDDRASRVPGECAGHVIAGDSEKMIQDVREMQCREVLIAVPLASSRRYLELASKLRRLPVDVRILPELGIAELPLTVDSSQQLPGIPMLTLVHKPMSLDGALCKRLIDLALTIPALVVLSPVFALLALAIKVDSRGPVFFKQPRYGYQNDIFNVLKFRTMYQQATDRDGDRLTSSDDDRVTRVGRFLRRTSLDELPQLINVLRNDMSLVGPRPHALKAKAAGKLYDDVTAEYGYRVRVKPGLTGWAQVNGWRGNTETERDLTKRVEHDLYYIENWSNSLDLRILLMTLSAVVKGTNSY